MKPKEVEINEWELEAIHNRYRAAYQLTLTSEQAKLLYNYEQLRDTPSKNYYFSFWEELDFEGVSFQQILTPEQFENYKKNQQGAISKHEQWLVQQDKDCLNQINALEDLLHYYENQMLPNLEKQQMLVGGAFNDDKEKVAYLKSEYRKFLNNSKKAILVSHFRQSKTFQPNLLQLAFLRFKLMCLLPDYFSFQTQMDTPTRAVADYLEGKLKKRAEILNKELHDVIQALKNFRKTNVAKHIGEIAGWHVASPNEEDNLMFFLLLDRQKYNC